jgi:uroporphyrinogen decarboxylase
MISHKEWIESSLDHRETRPVPYNFSFSPPIRRILEQRLGTDDVEAFLDFPIRCAEVRSSKPLYADPTIYGNTIKDDFGVIWSTNSIDRGAPVGPCLEEPDLSRYHFPDPARPYRYEGLEAWCQKNRDHFTMIWVGDLWERATFMRGMENLLFDISLHPRFVEELLSRLTDYILRTMEELFRRCAFDCIAVSDDYGTQKDLLISPSDWRKLIKPCLARIYALAKKNGRRIFHHSCGNNSRIVADFIDIGLDILHPIQPEAMDIQYLKKQFGKDLSLCGGIPTQTLLRDGTPQEIRKEVRRILKVMGRDGGFIIEPGITLQADIPISNCLAMIEEATQRNFIGHP